MRNYNVDIENRECDHPEVHAVYVWGGGGDERFICASTLQLKNGEVHDFKEIISCPPEKNGLDDIFNSEQYSNALNENLKKMYSFLDKLLENNIKGDTGDPSFRDTSSLMHLL